MDPPRALAESKNRRSAPVMRRMICGATSLATVVPVIKEANYKQNVTGLSNIHT
ncbi:hypothetical protein ACX12E_20920 [Paenibacillus vandeheii]